MTKKELIRQISERKTISIKEATKYVNTVLGAIGDALADKNSVIIPDFGKFSVRTIPEHKGTNPNTLEKIIIPQKDRIVFRPYSRIKSYSTIN